MRRRSAVVAILILIAILILSVLDGALGQPFTFVPESLVAPVVAILSGVAIGVIIHGLTAGDSSGAPRPNGAHEQGDTGGQN